MDITTLASSSRGNCYSVTDGQSRILIECGISFPRILQGTGHTLTDHAGCLLSHEHGDHACSVAKIMKAGLDVYCSAGTRDALGLTGHRLHTVKHAEQFSVGSFSVVAFNTQHDAAEPLGFLIQSHDGSKLLFATDTYYLAPRFRGLTHIMIECNYSPELVGDDTPKPVRDRLFESHMSLGTCKDFLATTDLSSVREIHLIHLSAGHSDADRFKREIQQQTGKPVYVSKE